MLLGCGLAPLVPSSLGRCGRVELGGLEFDGAALVWQYACPDGGSESPGWWVGADLRPQASSHPSSCQVTGLGVILEARRGRAAGLWLALSRPFPVPHLFPASPGREVYASPTTSVPFVSSFCTPRPAPLPAPGVSAQPPPPRPAALGFRRADKQSPGLDCSHTRSCPGRVQPCSGRPVQQGFGGPTGSRGLGRGSRWCHWAAHSAAALWYVTSTY